MHIGEGVRPGAMEKVFADSGLLAEGEQVLACVKSSQFSPPTDTIALTSARLMAIASHGGSSPIRALYSEIAEVAADQVKGTVQVITVDRRSVTFKAVPKQDVPIVEDLLKAGMSTPLSAMLLDSLAQLEPAASTVLKSSGERPENYKAARREAKASERADRGKQKAAARAEQEATTLEAYGVHVGGGSFGGKVVEFYDKGYVRIALWPTANTPFEKLVAIESSGDIAKKSAAGRAAGAVLTGGLNLLSSNKRGDLYLTIVTETTTHVLHVDPPTAMGMRSAKALEGAGRGLLLRLQATAGAEAAGASPSSDLTDARGDAATVAERLRQLGQMRDEGLISSEEFDALRTKILDHL